MKNCRSSITTQLLYSLNRERLSTPSVYLSVNETSPYYSEWMCLLAFEMGSQVTEPFRPFRRFSFTLDQVPL